MNKNTSKNKEKDDKNFNKEKEVKIQKEEIKVEELKIELKQAQQSTKENWDKLLRSQAEIENIRRRSQKDIENAHKFAIESFVKALLEINDSLAMGIKSANEENATITSVKEGVEITYKTFISTLEKFNIKQLNPIGEKFNPEYHEAITMIKDDDKKSGDIIDVVQSGFTLNARVVRPAMVIVTS